jgi:peptidoglycan/LPS O-acetylase OafA/YrhL
LWPAQAFLALVVTALALTLATPGTRRELLAGVPSSLLYFSNWVKAYDGWNQGALTHTWSLAIEEQYYLLWPPIVVGLAWRHGRQGVAVGAAAGLLFTLAARTGLYAVGSDLDRLYNGTDTRAPGIMIGSLLGALVIAGRRDPRVQRRAPGIAGAALVCFLALTMTLPESRAVMGLWLLAVEVVAAVLIVAAVRTPEDTRVGRFLANAPLVAVGRVSYGLYLWHKAVIVLINGDRLGMSRWQEVAVETVVFSLATFCSWRLVERPLQRRYRSRLAVRRAARPAGQVSGRPSPDDSVESGSVREPA